MITQRNKDDRGHTQTDWLNGRHTFSFGGYFDPNHMGFGALRVINDDHIDPNAGFGEHPHRNMEIITYVINGELSHKDSMGHRATIVPGEVQIMSAGSGITHSEFNGSSTEDLHLLQIWIVPDEIGMKPSYQQKAFDFDSQSNTFITVASHDASDEALHIKQDAKLHIGKFDTGKETTITIQKNRKYWLQIATGEATINTLNGTSGDGFSIENENVLTIQPTQRSEILLFDLPQ